MKRPAIFFDRDNTLIANDGYLGDPNGVTLVAGAADAVARARKLGFVVVTVSNQSGVARGMFEEAAVHAVNRRMDELLREQNPDAVIDRHEFCPFHPEASVEAYRCESDLRKPRPGMILKAAEEMDLDLTRSWLIGDAPRDVEAGAAAGCRTVLFQDEALSVSPAAGAEGKVRPDFVARSLDEAMDHIQSNADGAAGSGNDGEATAAGATTSPGETGGPAPAPLPQPARATDATVLPRVSLEKLEHVTEQILHELRRSREQPSEFSIPKMLAGIVQVLALAALFMAYLNRDKDTQPILLLALVLQTLTIALMMMGKK